MWVDSVKLTVSVSAFLADFWRKGRASANARERLSCKGNAEIQAVFMSCQGLLLCPLRGEALEAQRWVTGSHACV